MKVTVDASVIVKWFVAEPRHAAARLVLEDGIERHAPGFVLIESANVLWRKSRDGEIVDPTLLLQQLVDSHILKLHRSEDLLLDAASKAEEAGHSVYDCLYVACAERAGTALVTDDKRLAAVVSKRFPRIRSLRLDDQAAVRRIQAAASPLLIEHATLDELIATVGRLDATMQTVFDAWFSATGGVRRPTADEHALIETSVPLQELLRLIDTLSDEERGDLLALGWLGLGRQAAESWDALLLQANQTVADYDSRQVAALCHYWASGREQLASRKARIFAS